MKVIDKVRYGLCQKRPLDAVGYPSREHYSDSSRSYDQLVAQSYMFNFVW
jgi:hypothetical protein